MAIVYIPDDVVAKVIATGTDKQKFVKDAVLEKLAPRKAVAVNEISLKEAIVDKYGKAMISRTLAGRIIEWREKDIGE